VADLIWRETAPGVEEADGPGGAKFLAARAHTFIRVYSAAFNTPEQIDLLSTGGVYTSMNDAKAACHRLASWAASCGAAQDGKGRGEVGL